MIFRKTAILGVGLLGGSLALAMREKGLTGEISGFGRSAENLEKAKAWGIIDSCHPGDPAGAAAGADLVVLATSVSAFGQIARAIKGSLKEGSIQTDVGSLKGGLVYELEEILPRYVGCHPIAGGERPGIGAATGRLFEGSKCIMTKTGKSDPEAVEALAGLWEAVGCRIRFMDPFLHDEVYALVSHLPHLVASALVNTVGEADGDLISFAGRGFRDSTRIAMSSPELWSDICRLNGKNILRFADIFKKEIERFESLIGGSDAEALKSEFDSARTLRGRLENEKNH